MMSFNTMHLACASIEQDGVEGFWACSELVGTQQALCLLMTHLRRQLGSMVGWPASALIDEQVNTILEKELPGLVAFLKEPSACFYTDKNYWADNFSAFAIEWNGKFWPTVEHAYQAAKFHDEEIINRIHQAVSPHVAKKIAHEDHIVCHVRKDWDDVKVSIMRELLICKVLQHEYVRSKLGRTKGVILIENSPTDSFWGRGPDWLGLNMLGKLWMEIRGMFFPE